MATIAVFLALGGGAYAALKLPRNSVGSKLLKANAVTSSKVKDGSLLVGDFKAGQLPAGAKGDAGPQGIQGIQGIQGMKGDPCLPSDTNCKGPKGDQGDPGPGAVKISGEVPSTTNGVFSTVNVGPWRVDSSCNDSGNAEFLVDVHGPGIAEIEKVISVDDANPGISTDGMQLVSGGGFHAAGIQATPGHFNRLVLTMELHDGTSVAQVRVNGLADKRSGGRCQVYGAAIPTG